MKDNEREFKFGDVVNSTFSKRQNNLRLILGKESSGDIVFTSLLKNSNILVSGHDEMAMAEIMHCFILSLLLGNEKCLFFLMDLKGHRFNVYKDIDTVDYVTDADNVAGRLNWLVNEMNARYKYMSENGSREISDTSLARMVCVIDDLSELIRSNEEIEPCISKLVQNSRQSGIHFIIGMKNQKVDASTELIRKVITAKMCLKEQSDSKFLFIGKDMEEPILVQAPYVSEEDKWKVAREAETFFKGKGLPVGLIPAAVPQAQSAGKKRKRVGFFQGLRNIINSSGNMTTDEFVALHYMNKK